ncbi:helix-turn-helix domain-containing protein [Amycolatopsis sp. NPDC003865]
MSSRLSSLDERGRIADRVREPGVSLRAIAAELGRPVSTISRGLDRNQQPNGVYPPGSATAADGHPDGDDQRPAGRGR